ATPPTAAPFRQPLASADDSGIAASAAASNKAGIFMNEVSCETVALSTAQPRCGSLARSAAAGPRRRHLHTRARGFARLAWRRTVSTGREGDRHGQGSNAQQQGKEETESRQEPQEGRRRALAVLVRQDAGRAKPEQPEELTLWAHRRFRTGSPRPAQGYATPGCGAP